MGCRVEFTVEPFAPGQPGPHVLAAIGAAQLHGVNVEVGPFGNVICGPVDDVLAALSAAVRAALAAGATRVSTQIENTAEPAVR